MHCPPPRLDYQSGDEGLVAVSSSQLEHLALVPPLFLPTTLWGVLIEFYALLSSHSWLLCMAYLLYNCASRLVVAIYLNPHCFVGSQIKSCCDTFLQCRLYSSNPSNILMGLTPLATALCVL